MSKDDIADATVLAKRAYKLRPQDAEAVSLLGLCLVENDSSREEGFSNLRAAITAEPNEPRWHIHLGQGLTKHQRYDEAEAEFAVAAHLSNGHSAVLMQWANALRLAGRAADATQVYARVLQQNPSPKVWLAASEALTEARDTINAAFAYEKAYPEEGRPDFATAKLADMHITLGNYDKAKQFNAKLREAHPDNVEAGLREANLLRWDGDIDGAKTLLLSLWETRPDHAGLAAALLEEGVDAGLERVKKAAQDHTLTIEARRRCAFSLCHFMDKSGDTQAAWDWAVLANSLYPETQVSDVIAPLRDMLDKAVMAYHLMPDAEEAATSRATKMIYIVGPPRSGGSLLQTILSRYAGARSVGERGALMSFLPQLLDDPEKLAAQIEQLATADIAGMTRAVGMADYFIDKTPHYFLLAGLLGKVHASAQFIAPHRELKDMAVSLFFHEFGAEFPFTRSIADIQDYLNFHEAAIVRWREAGVDIWPHNHDRFIEDPTTRGQNLIESLGLIWDEELLEDQAGDGAVRTFSARQVRGGVTQKFQGRGERYAKNLAAAGFID